MAQGIYCWLNTLNGKVYVGSGQDLERRRAEHTRSLTAGTHFNLHLQAAWNLYGAGVFKFIVIEDVPDLLWLRARESAWILRLQASVPAYGYNHTGDGWSPSPTTQEARAALRKAWVGRKARGDYYKFTPEQTATAGALGRASLKKKWQDPAWRADIQRKQKKGWTPEARAAKAKQSREYALAHSEEMANRGRKGAAATWS